MCGNRPASTSFRKHWKAPNDSMGCANKQVALGWPLDRIIVIDSDLGLSGASSDREGFRLPGDRSKLGAPWVLMLGLEVSRLARNSTD